MVAFYSDLFDLYYQRIVGGPEYSGEKRSHKREREDFYLTQQFEESLNRDPMDMGPQSYEL